MVLWVVKIFFVQFSGAFLPPLLRQPRKRDFMLVSLFPRVASRHGGSKLRPGEGVRMGRREEHRERGVGGDRDGVGAHDSPVSQCHSGLQRYYLSTSARTASGGKPKQLKAFLRTSFSSIN